MNIHDIIYQAILLNCEFIDHGAQLEVTNWSKLTDELKATLKANKNEIHSIVKYDNFAKQFGFIIAVPGEFYAKSINHFSDVYIHCVNGIWTAWKESYSTKGNTVYKEIVNNNDLIQVFFKVNQYIGYLKKSSNQNNV